MLSQGELRRWRVHRHGQVLVTTGGGDLDCGRLQGPSPELDPVVEEAMSPTSARLSPSRQKSLEGHTCIPAFHCMLT